MAEPISVRRGTCTRQPLAPARYDGMPGTGYDFRRWLTPEVTAGLKALAQPRAPRAPVLVESTFYRNQRLQRERE